MMGLHLETLADLGLKLGWHGGLAGGTGAAALPALALQQLWLRLGWGLVLAALVGLERPCHTDPPLLAAHGAGPDGGQCHPCRLD